MGHLIKCGALPIIKPYLLAIRFHCVRPSSRKGNSSLPISLEFICITTHVIDLKEYPCSGSGILSQFTFNPWCKVGQFETKFSYLLGSTNPSPIAVHIESFSTLVFKVLFEYHQCLLLTTIKILTIGCFTQANTKGCFTIPMPYSSELCYLSLQLSISATLERHLFSGLVDLAGV